MKLQRLHGKITITSRDSKARAQVQNLAHINLFVQSNASSCSDWLKGFYLAKDRLVDQTVAA